MSLLQTTKILALVLVPLIITGCVRGQLDPNPMLTTLHLKKSEEYKKRPGWQAFEKLATDDCRVYKSGGKSLFKWSDITCDASGAIKYINETPNVIPIFYAAYHEYGGYEMGGFSSFDNAKRLTEEVTGMFANLAKELNNPEKVNAIYADYESDRWSMGLNEISESDFKNHISSFAAKQQEFMSQYQQAQNNNQQRYKAEHEAAEKQKREKNIASERPINLVLWDNPTQAQRQITDALGTIKFTIRNDGWAYANGRRFMGISGLESFRNSLDMSLTSCSDVGAYIGESSIAMSCANGLAQDIVEWGKTAKNSSISNTAWNAAAVDSSINYNVIKYEISFSHWVGMARVYASRGL
ncbi:hypothetical protein [Rahnella inusitata]|uniref:hypothetical protein n=1 Tax=Rahnella inusitata TaxID=58169 RepID=UPI0039AF1BE9